MIKKKRAVIYVRRSLEDKHEKISLQNQEDMCVRKAIAEGYETVAIIREEASAYNMPIEKRPELQKLFNMALDGEIDVVVCWQSSRLIRNVADHVIVQKVLVEDSGCEVVFADSSEPSFANDEFSFLIRLIKSWQDEVEVAKLRKRVKDALRNKMKNGKYVGGNFTGYVWNKHTKRFDQDPELIEMVKLIFQLYLYDGLTTKQIADVFNERGYKTVNGNSFYQASINTILRNKIYCGFYRWGFTTSRVRSTPEAADGEEIKVDWIDPIISLEDWEQAQDIMISRSKKKRGQKIRRHNSTALLLTGMVFCGHCSNLMGTRNDSTNYKRKGEVVLHRKFRYVCNNEDPKHPKPKRFNAEIIDELVLKETAKLIQSFNRDELFKQALVEIEKRKDEHLAQKNKISKSMDQMNKEINTLWINLGRTTDEDLVTMYNQRIRQLNENIKESERRLNDNNNDIKFSQVEKKHLDEFLGMMTSFLTSYEGFTMEKKRLYLERLVDKVFVHRDNVEIHLRLNFHPASDVILTYKEIFKTG